MKNLFTILLGLLSISLLAQTGIKLRIEHTMDGDDLQFGQGYSHPDMNYDFSITRLQYYVSEISIVHDGGQTTPVEDTWLLVDAGVQEDFDLGQHDVTNVEGIIFHVGVDPDHNHLDPTTYPAGHPLAPQEPSMHWGWLAGYRFACLEGMTGPGLLFIYQIHALGDDNYWETSIPTAAVWEGGGLVIIIRADYFGMLASIDVSGGLIWHSDKGEAATLLENFSNEVYSQILFIGIPENPGTDPLGVFPNPSHNGRATVTIGNSAERDSRILVTDLAGSVIRDLHVNGLQSIDLDLGGNGMYFLQLWSGGRLVQAEKLIVSR